MLSYKIILLSLATFFLNSCNLKPLYARDSHVNTKLCQIQLLDIGHKRHEYELYKELSDRLSTVCKGDEEKVYDLHISVFESEQAVLLTRTGDTKRNMIKLNASIIVTNKATNKPAFTHSFYNTDSFNTLDSPFNEYVASNNSKENAAIGLSNMIINRIQFWLRDQKSL